MQHLTVRSGLAALCLLAASAAQAAPTLIGDSIDFLRAYPSVDTPYGPSIASTVVAAGTSDRVAWGSATFLDPEADSLTLTFDVLSTYIGSGTTFDGYVISGFDHDIAAVTLLDDTTGMAIELAHGLRSFTIDLTGTAQAHTAFRIGITLVDPGATGVPEPAMPALLATALAGLALARRRGSRPVTAGRAFR